VRAPSQASTLVGLSAEDELELAMLKSRVAAEAVQQVPPRLEGTLRPFWHRRRDSKLRPCLHLRRDSNYGAFLHLHLKAFALAIE